MTLPRQVVGLVACLAAGCADPAPPTPAAVRPPHPAVEVVRQFVGRDLAEADVRPLEDALRDLDPIRGPVDRPIRGLGGLGLSVWHVCPFGRPSGPPGYVVVEAERGRQVPGSTGVRLTLVDEGGAVLARSEFTTGWRRWLTAVRLAPLAEGGEPAIVLECDEWGVRGLGRDYVALVGSRFDLVRVEEVGGAVGRNWYYVHHYRHGPPIFDQPEEGWEADLCSTDRARVLRALTWLGGRHRLPAPPGEQRDAQYETDDQVGLVGRVRARASVNARLRDLAAGEDDWLRDAARLAQQPMDVQ